MCEFAPTKHVKERQQRGEEAKEETADDAHVFVAGMFKNDCFKHTAYASINFDRLKLCSSAGPSALKWPPLSPVQ